MAYEIFIGDAGFCAACGFLAGILVANLGWNLLAVVAWMVIGTLAVVVMSTFVTSEAIGMLETIKAVEKTNTLIKSAPKLAAVFAAICLAVFFSGAFYYRFDLARRAAETKLPTGKSATFSAIVSDEPAASAKYLFFTADLERPYAGTMTIFAPLGSYVRYGDELKIAAVIEPPETPGDTPAAFPQKIKFIAAHRGFWLREELIDFKAAVLAKFNEALPGGDGGSIGGIGVSVSAGDEAALLGGETLGGTDGMSAPLKNEMSASGTSYITAMYGYKIFVIVAFIEAALANLVARRVRFVAALAVVVLFVLMAGGGASVIRGAIMGVLALIAKHTGRIFNMRNALAFTAVAMALWDPTILTQAVFLLSFLSVIGIVYLVRPIEKMFGWGSGALEAGNTTDGVNILDWREAIVVATASLLPIVPVIAIAFGDFSLSAFPSNALIALPLSAVTFFGFILALVGFLPAAGWLAFFVAKFASVILLYQIAVIKIFAVVIVPMPSAFETPLMIAAYYVALAWFAHT